MAEKIGNINLRRRTRIFFRLAILGRNYREEETGKGTEALDRATLRLETFNIRLFATLKYATCPYYIHASNPRRHHNGVAYTELRRIQ